MWAFHTSRHGSKYFASIAEDVTRYRWILLLKTKDKEIPNQIAVIAESTLNDREEVYKEGWWEIGEPNMVTPTMGGRRSARSRPRG